MQSLPLRKCGLKQGGKGTEIDYDRVTSLAEVWIEILFCQVVVVLLTSVTSLAEVWIEIQDKSYQAFLCHVTSLAEVWIEI